jgi:peptidoglycan/xylan/chitin deacetylase (PgdA/CDA1 family)
MKRKLRPNNKGILILVSLFVVLFAGLMFALSDRFKTTPQTPVPTETLALSPTPSQTPEASATPEPQASETPEPQESQVPEQKLVIRTDYEAFQPNEAGDIPVVMFHRFVDEYDGDKEYTTTFKEFEALLETLYNQGYRLISMQDFIDCNISVPAGTMPMVFTFDDGTPGQFNLIEENGKLKVNPKSAVGIMMAFNEKHPDFGLKGIFYVNMDIGDNTFMGAGSLRERFEILESLGLEIGTHTWGHVDYRAITTTEKIQESIGKNQKRAEEVLPGLRFYSLALPYGSRPKDKNLWPALQNGTYEGVAYHHDTIMAVGAEPSVPSISKKYDSSYVHRIRSQGKDPVDCDLTWWLSRMTASRMFISDGDPETIVVPESKADKVDTQKLGSKRLVTY